MNHELPEVFSKNRSEESYEDNWSEFLVPPFLENLQIKSQSKALVIVGGRGCGKTTLLRYFSHATQFSPKRRELPEEALSHIGLYWRADTNFLNAFVGSGQDARTWRSAFEHVLACDIGLELLQSLLNLNCTQERVEKYGGLEALDLSDVQDFDESLGATLPDLKRSLESAGRKLSTWINNLDRVEKPRFLPLNQFLDTIVTAVCAQLPYLADTSFAVFFDEYENLRKEQQQYINGLLKHGKPPLLFNIAMKRNGFHTWETLGPESIQLTSDYRIIDLEDETSNNDFELFAAELLFFRLAEHNPSLLSELPIVPNHLRDVTKIDSRYKNLEYRNRVVGAAKSLLPRVSPKAAAAEIFSDNKLKQKLTLRIENALRLRESDIPVESFLDEKHSDVSVVISALLYRPRESPPKLLADFSDIQKGQTNRLTDEVLLSTNLFGCVNAIYLDANRDSILFSGFKSLTLIARENVRHLLELIHRVFKAYSSKYEYEGLPKVPPELQAKAVRQASEQILSDVSGGCGKYGPQLQNLARSLGSIFRELHRSQKQSEPETNHFTLSGGELDSNMATYLAEAEKWSVLYRAKETKMKSTGAMDADLILNPVFSPFFQISYRKRRSTAFTASDLLCMLEGDQATRDSLVRKLTKRSPSDTLHLDLFDESN